MSNNIAEGFERGSTNELLMFICIARGSAGEVRSMLRRCERDSDFADLKSEISGFVSLAESCSRQLRGWAGTLQDGDIPGQRHLIERSKSQWDQRRRSDAFMQRLRREFPLPGTTNAGESEV